MLQWTMTGALVLCGLGLAVTGAATGASTGAATGSPEGEKGKGQRLTERHQASYADGGMARWQAAMTPELAHEFLAEHFEGEWKATMRVSTGMNQGMGPPSEGTATGSPILGGRYIEVRSKGSMMGMPIEGVTVLGYDTVRKLFHATMFDTIGTGVKTLWGNLDKTGTVLTLVGEMDEPMSGEIGKSFLVAWTFHEDGSQMQEVKEILYGEAFTVVTIESVRAEAKKP